MGEKWKPVVGFADYYEVSNLGRVPRSTRGVGTHPGKVLRPGRKPEGYLFVNLSANGKQYIRHVHRLVIEAFSGSPPTPKHSAVHKNGDRADNRAENLAWQTHADRIRETYRVRPGVIASEKNRCRTKLNEAAVLNIRQRYADGAVTAALADEYGVSEEAIRTIARGGSWEHVGGPRTTRLRKVSEDAVQSIRARHAEGGVTMTDLAAEHRISLSGVSRIINRNRRVEEGTFA